MRHFWKLSRFAIEIEVFLRVKRCLDMGDEEIPGQLWGVTTWHKSPLDQGESISRSGKFKIDSRQSCSLAIELGRNRALTSRTGGQLKPTP